MMSNEVADVVGQSKELVQALDRLQALRDAKKEAARDFADQIDAAQKNIERIANDVRTGQRSLFAIALPPVKPVAAKPPQAKAAAPKKAKSKGGKK